MPIIQLEKYMTYTLDTAGNINEMTSSAKNTGLNARGVAALLKLKEQDVVESVGKIGLPNTAQVNKTTPFAVTFRVGEELEVAVTSGLTTIFSTVDFPLYALSILSLEEFGNTATLVKDNLYSISNDAYLYLFDKENGYCIYINLNGNEKLSREYNKSSCITINPDVFTDTVTLIESLRNNNSEAITSPSKTGTFSEMNTALFGRLESKYTVID